MTDIFPLDSSHIGLQEDGTWRLENVLPVAIELIIKEAAGFGIKCTIAQRQLAKEMGKASNIGLDVVFQSKQDLNFYKLVGSCEEGTVQIFSDSGLCMHVDILFVLYGQHYTEFYG